MGEGTRTTETRGGERRQGHNTGTTVRWVSSTLHDKWNVCWVYFTRPSGKEPTESLSWKVIGQIFNRADFYSQLGQ